ncbi:MAG: hypothetical protein N3F03_04275 [Ignavibacteria bacterium]|nr:hypothetical protein [Ignavibacteria bacterium]
MIEINNFNTKRITDFIAYSVLYYYENFKTIFFEITLVNYLIMGFLYLIFISLGGEFNLTFFLSNEGKTFLILVVISFLIINYNLIYKSFRLICLNNLELKNAKTKLKIFLISFLRNTLLILTILAFFFESNYLMFVLAFMIVNTISYRIIFYQKYNSFNLTKPEISLKEILSLDFDATKLIILNRLLLLFVPTFLTISIFLVIDFFRILLSGKLFFFVYDRLTELLIFGIFGLVIYLLIIPFQFISLMIFYNHHYEKNFDRGINSNLNTNQIEQNHS